MIVCVVAVACAYHPACVCACVRVHVHCVHLLIFDGNQCCMVSQPSMNISAVHVLVVIETIHVGNWGLHPSLGEALLWLVMA